MKNAFSVDLEDWYHPQLLKGKVKPQQRRSQIVDSTTPILQLLDRYKIRATFFVLGEVARENPDLIKRIYSQGHEIGSHGMSHKPFWEIGKDGFCQELDEFARLMNKILGNRVCIKGYRAPSFSLDNSTKWALEVLKKKGYMYDSSIFPVKNKLYGLNGAPLEVYRPSLSNLKNCDSKSDFLEFPLAVCDILGVRIPVAGGFYLRAMPLFLLKGFLKRINKNRPFVFYLHPWETYGHTPRIKGLSAVNYFITYWGIGSVLTKLEDLLKSFSFKPICEVLGG